MTYKLPGVKPHVKSAANHFGIKHKIKSVGGWRAVGSVPSSDHPKGLALDFMTRDKGQGDALTADVVSNYQKWGVTYVIWWRRIWSPSKGWRKYSGPSAHTDHVHVSFQSTLSNIPDDTLPVGNPFVPDGIEDSLNAFKNIADLIGDPSTWKRLGLYLAGFILIVLGFTMLFLDSGSKVVTKVAGKTVLGKAGKVLLK